MLAGLILAEVKSLWAAQSIFEKGQISGKILFEVGSMFVGVGALKHATTLEKLAAVESKFKGAAGFLGNVAVICKNWSDKIKVTASQVD